MASVAQLSDGGLTMACSLAASTPTAWPIGNLAVPYRGPSQRVVLRIRPSRQIVRRRPWP
jgi:hypothetical protein